MDLFGLQNLYWNEKSILATWINDYRWRMVEKQVYMTSQSIIVHYQIFLRLENFLLLSFVASSREILDVFSKKKLWGKEIMGEKWHKEDKFLFFLFFFPLVFWVVFKSSLIFFSFSINKIVKNQLINFSKI